MTDRSLQSERNPVSLEDFAIRHGLEQLLHDSQLLETFRNHDRVIHNEKNDTWAWRPDFDVRTPNDLLRVVQKRYLDAYPPQAHGFRLSELRESYPATREAVDSFSKRTKRKHENGNDPEDAEQSNVVNGPQNEDERMPEEESKKILILPGARDGQIKQVYFNEASTATYIAQNGGKVIEPVDEGT